MKLADSPSEIRAIPTEYAGVKLKSRLEAQAAYLFDCLGWKWEYEPFSIMLDNGVPYTPDFLLYDENLIVECRGYTTAKGQSQTQGFSELIASSGYQVGDLDFIYRYLVIGPDGIHFWSQKAHFNPARACLICFCAECAQWRALHVDSAFCQNCLCSSPSGTFLTRALALGISEGRILLNSTITSENWKDALIA